LAQSHNLTAPAFGDPETVFGNFTDPAITGIDGFETEAGSGSVGLIGANPVPIAIGTLFPHQEGAAQVSFSWPSTVKREQFTVRFSANNGAFKSLSTIHVESN
jgi:hypothetical protein